MTVAPEIDGAEEFVKFVCQNGGNISVGHTDADYKTAMGALNAGASSFTHLFNAMRGIHHREAGTAGAALLSGAYTELICDGLHLCPEIICLALRLKGYEKIILVTDSMKATGLNDGIYNFGGLKVNVKGAEARLDDGTLAGSTLRLVDGVRNLEKFTGLPFKKVVMTATLNPARATGIDAFTGSIEPGKRADLVILDDDKNIIYTISSGTIVYQRESS
jgi:N-acetylglucosamine-6-phosphate deacetylase